MTMTELILIGSGLTLGIIVLISLFDMVFTVNTQEAAIVERFGKFLCVASEGLNFKIPFIDRVVKRLNLKVTQMNVPVETKTKDNVFVKTQVSVQYQIIREKVKDAHYKLTNAKEQIISYVFDVVRSEIPKLDLDEVFVNKDTLAQAIKSNLAEAMDDFGFCIIKSLVTDIDPDPKVKDSMNEINAAERLRDAELAKAEAKKITIVKEAEAQAESKRLQGIGLANQRKEIANGLVESIKSLGDTGINNDEIMKLILITQHYDAIEAVSKNSQTTTIMLPYSANGVTSMAEQIREGMLSTKIPNLAPVKQIG